MQSTVFKEATDGTSLSCSVNNDDRFEYEHGGGGCVSVIEELDGLLAAIRLLIRTCEKQVFHRETHALELSLELVLRRRNYILNVSMSNKSLPYDSFPCENCYITYPTCFVMSWLDYLLQSLPEVQHGQNTGNENSDETGGDLSSLDSSLCNRSCLLRFGTSTLGVNHLIEGALYPMGAPFVAGPKDGPPGALTRRSTHLIGELDELQHVRNTLCLVLKTLRAKDESSGGGESSADVALAESVLNLIDSRRHFGFDLGCVNDADVNLCRLQLQKVLETYEHRVLSETFDREIRDRHQVVAC